MTDESGQGQITQEPNVESLRLVDGRCAEAKLSTKALD